MRLQVFLGNEFSKLKQSLMPDRVRTVINPQVGKMVGGLVWTQFTHKTHPGWVLCPGMD
jgi:hypothetical protein